MSPWPNPTLIIEAGNPQNQDQGAIVKDGDLFAGLLLGGAVGDALGLPAEGLSRRAIQRRWIGRWKMRLAFGYGMISDDTEHALMVATSLVNKTIHPLPACPLRIAVAGFPVCS